MNIIEAVGLLLLILLWVVSVPLFLFARAKLLMMFFQQDEYDNRRFLRFTFKNLKLVDKKLTSLLLAIAILTVIFAMVFLDSARLLMEAEFMLADDDALGDFYRRRNYPVTLFAGSTALALSIIMLVFSFVQKALAGRARKALVMTNRVKRILAIFFILYIIVALQLFLGTAFIFGRLIEYLHIYTYSTKAYIASPFPLSIILLVQLVPFLLVLANIILSPYEKYTQSKFLSEAKAKLAQINPTIIGITGSYGKTSTKHIMAHITSSSVPIFFPPGGVNTPMGITRVIREKLKPEHKFFVSEMGAYGRGSIKRLCNLTPPTHGILTAVGNMHYERFKTQDTVAEAKFELAEAVFKKGGKMVINADLVKQEYIDRFTSGHKDDVILVSHTQHKGYTTHIISNEQLTPDGIRFTFNFNGTAYDVQAPVYGMHQISNIAEAFVMATILGIAPETVVASIKTLPQITHRLEVFRKPDSPIVIDDTYNSNPVGFRSALGVLNVLKREGGKRIVVSPGMVELGDMHEQEHFELGKEIGRQADIFVAVIPRRIKSLIDGFRSTADLSHQQIIEIDTANEATSWINTNASALDVVLYANNNLPDLYESKIRI